MPYAPQISLKRPLAPLARENLNDHADYPTDFQVELRALSANAYSLIADIYLLRYSGRPVKPLRFIGSSLRAVQAFPEPARRAAGFELWQVQCGSAPSDFKPMPAIGPGVQEIRIHLDGEWRVVLVATWPEAVYVLHAFRKKSQKSSPLDLALARTRFKRLKQEHG